MRMRWRLILPIFGLSLFAFVSYHPALRPANSRYFWWSTVRLDADPLNKRLHAPKPCEGKTEACIDWDDIVWDLHPGWQAKLLIFSALPAFLVGATVVDLLSRLGISQILSFMVSMPLLLAAWYYFVGWLIDRRLYKKRPKRHPNLG